MSIQNKSFRLARDYQMYKVSPKEGEQVRITASHLQNWNMLVASDGGIIAFGRGGAGTERLKKFAREKGWHLTSS